MSDPVLQAIYDAFPPNSEGRKALLFTRWKDGIDIDVPTAEASALYDHAKEEGRKAGMQEAAEICGILSKQSFPASKKQIFALACETILAAMEAK